jgi:hypothetical protein
MNLFLDTISSPAVLFLFDQNNNILSKEKHIIK